MQEYDFTKRHRKGSLNGNADALSRPPIACADLQPVAMLAVVETQPWCFDSDSQDDRITYATGDEELNCERGSDSGPSVPVELPCEGCESPGRDDIMLLCGCCNKGTHTTCLIPPLTRIPKGVWLCQGCEKMTHTVKMTHLPHHRKLT